MDLRSFAREYLDYLAKVRFLSAATVRAYTRDISSFTDWIEEEKLAAASLSAAEVRGYMTCLSRRRCCGGRYSRC
ncbi:MAG: site-specific integrase [Spirochaetales bacterium]|jgi:site-specific recombinase XerD|nr:site-specific integrase [Spirochaetales bacterium]